VRGALGKTKMVMVRQIDPVDTLAAVNLGRLDLNLLVALDALLQQRSDPRRRADGARSACALGLAGAAAAEAPRARLRMSLMNPNAADLAEQVLLDADVLLMPHGFITDLPHLDLFRDDWVCVVAAGNREVGDVLTREQLATAPWVVSFHGPTASTPALRQLRMAGWSPPLR
jgi:hypothetical protein